MQILAHVDAFNLPQYALLQQFGILKHVHAVVQELAHPRNSGTPQFAVANAKTINNVQLRWFGVPKHVHANANSFLNALLNMSGIDLIASVNALLAKDHV